MAPEQLNGQPVDARADVFAFGVLMYEYACGVHPFAASTELARIARVLESDARPLEERCPQLPVAIADAVARCLRKAPAERYGSAGEILAVINRDLAVRSLHRSMIWWRMHQLSIMAVYVIAAAVAWHLKEAFVGATSLWLFIGIGIAAAIGGILRGHLLFTEQINRPRLVAEWRRTARANLIVELLMAAALFADALRAVPTRALWALLTMALAVGIALAALLMEPATTTAAFGRRRVDAADRHRDSRAGRPRCPRAGRAPASGAGGRRGADQGGRRRRQSARRDAAARASTRRRPGASDIPGLEVAGTIEEVGADVRGWRAGDRVCALVAGGGYAEYCVAPAPQCLPVPRGMAS